MSKPFYRNRSNQSRSKSFNPAPLRARYDKAVAEGMEPITFLRWERTSHGLIPFHGTNRGHGWHSAIALINHKLRQWNSDSRRQESALHWYNKLPGGTGPDMSPSGWSKWAERNLAR